MTSTSLIDICQHCSFFSSFPSVNRYYISQSSNPPFISVELDHSDSGREGCTVTTLTVTAEPQNWQNAIKVAVQEVCFPFFRIVIRSLFYLIFV